MKLRAILYFLVCFKNVVYLIIFNLSNYFELQSTTSKIISQVFITFCFICLHQLIIWKISLLSCRSYWKIIRNTCGILVYIFLFSLYWNHLSFLRSWLLIPSLQYLNWRKIEGKPFHVCETNASKRKRENAISQTMRVDLKGNTQKHTPGPWSQI